MVIAVCISAQSFVRAAMQLAHAVMRIAVGTLTKSYRNYPISDLITRHVVRIEDGRFDYELRKIRQFEFMKELVNDGFYSGLLNCGSQIFDRMVIYYDHNANTWVCDLTADESLLKEC